MTIKAQINKILSSNRWLSFFESTATGLQLGLTLILPNDNQIKASTVCPVCKTPYLGLSKEDIRKALAAMEQNLPEFSTEDGASAVALGLDNEISFVVNDCTACLETGNLPLLKRAQITQRLLKSFQIALMEGFEGGRRAIEISTLRQMNHIILSLFQGEEDAAKHSFDLILSALIIILDAQGSWLELNDPNMPASLLKGDEKALKGYLNSENNMLGLSIEVHNGSIHGRLGILAPADMEQARDLLTLMAQECAIIIEIDKLFKLFHKRLIRVLEAIDSAIVVIDKNGIISFVNHPFEELVSISSLDAIGRPISSVDGPWLPFIESGIRRRIDGKMDYLKIKSDKIFVDWQVSPLIDDEIVQGWILLIKDRTDHYRWQEAIRQAERFATTAALVGSLAHELRNPLSAAKGLLQLIGMKRDQNRSSGYIDLIQRELDRVTKLLNEFLLLGKPADKESEPIVLASLLTDLLPLLKAEAQHMGSEVILDLRSNLSIEADPGQMTQVVMNLVRNAFEAAGEKGTVFVTLLESEEGISLRIKDSGPGIQPQVMEKLFRPFFTTKERGTGLGLAVVQAIIHNHGGEIMVQNHPEGGAVFEMILPPYRGGQLPKIDILMAISDRMFKYPSERAVIVAGFNIVPVNNLKDAQCFLERCQPKVVVVENCLLNDIEALERFRQNLGNAKLVILGELSESFTLEETIFLPKPINYTRLVSQVKLLMN